jgi:tetraacyldisaccharide 4'-kinase
MWLTEWLAARGWRPGIVGRGYRGRSATWPRNVTRDSDPAEVGDEPVLLARRTGVPLWVGPDRVAAARALVAAGDCDVIVSDDGLQHYALARNIEIAVLDGRRRLGNGRCLPSGPLREPPERLDSVDAVVVNGAARPGEYAMHLRLADAENLADAQRSRTLESFRGNAVHGVAGIGNPQRFFDQLRDRGIQVTAHPFPDHHPFTPEDLMIPGADPILMTEKDAVKCRRFATPRCWVIPARAEPEPALQRRLAELVDKQKVEFEH